jgi:aspartyl-tRNA(Asn)/glutamyl-tRNA(Gln) amidotransferase subunit A
VARVIGEPWPTRRSERSPCDLSLTEAAGAISAQSLSPVELTESCLGRIRDLEPSLRAFVTVDVPGARALAREAQEGLSPGALRGVPVAIKDLIDVAGLPTTASSVVLAGNVASSDAPVTQRLRAAGAVVVGKTNTQEFAYGVVSAPTRNPWNPGCIPGGSSGGSGAAVAAGMCLGALGTDTAGSIRIPAALCGITGLKPRPGTVPMDGIVPLSWSLDSCGPLARTAADVDLMWQALSGAPPARPAGPELSIGVPPARALGDVDEEVMAATDAAVSALCMAGAKRREVDFPDFSEWKPGPLLMTEALVAHREAGWYPARAEHYTEETLDNFRRAEGVPASEIVESRRINERLEERWWSALADVDILAWPTTPVAAPTVEEAQRGERDSPRRPVVLALTRLNGQVNWCGLASISVPCGFTREGLPVGAQFVGRDEATVIGVALRYQRVTDWHTRRPPLT